MKQRIIIFVIGVFWVMVSCQKPDPLLPSTARKGINSITATFEDGTGHFIGTPSEDGNKIIIPVPYYYPVSSNQKVTTEQLKNMRVKANLDDNVVVSPSLLYMDLTRENNIRVIDQKKEAHEYIVTGKITKSSACAIESFSLPALGISGVINEDTKTISLVAFGNVDSVLADVSLSPHATISPDPRTTYVDFNQAVTFTVTAHDEVSTCVYTVEKTIPGKLPYGIRPGSGKLLFAKELKSDVGIAADHLTGGIAATNEYLVLNTRGENSKVLDPRSGEVVKEIDLGSIKGNLTNFYNTADDIGNVLICNLAPNAGSFKIWRLSSLESTPELYLEWDGQLPVGRKLSIAGNLEEDALITAPIAQEGLQFARWEVSGGELLSQTPELVTMSGLEKGWTTNSDIVYSSSEPESDYFFSSYSDNTFAWVDGLSNVVHKKVDAISTNYIMNAVDFTEFNNAKYATTNWVNSFTWGAADMIWMMDVSGDQDFLGNLEKGTCDAVVWSTPPDTYGAKAVMPVVANANGTGDVAFTVSDDGYYLNVYFLFTNGYVVGYQFDCIDI